MTIADLPLRQSEKDTKIAALEEATLNADDKATRQLFLGMIQELRAIPAKDFKTRAEKDAEIEEALENGAEAIMEVTVADSKPDKKGDE